MTRRFRDSPEWLPSGKQGAVCITLDDVHPSSSASGYESGRDPSDSALGHLHALLTRHHELRATLFVTADWRAISPFPTRKWLAHIPGVRDHVFLSPRRPAGQMRLSRHPEFVDQLRSLPRVELAFHGLHHVARGLHPVIEFARLSAAECRRRLAECKAIFIEAKLQAEPGLCPPGWAASPQLISAMCDEGLQYLASARDLETAISPVARTAMSGLRGVSLIRPEPIADNRLLHFSVNFQATSEADRARRVIDGGGLLHIKAHAIKVAHGYVAKDGLDLRYRESLSGLFDALQYEYGDALWWTSLGEIARTWPREA